MITLDELRARMRTEGDRLLTAGLLAKPPAGVTVEEQIALESLGFHTNQVDVETRSSASVDPAPTEWRFWVLQKAEGSPFSDRISVGRALNCDIVVRVPFVSKLHAHFLPSSLGDAIELVDNASSNGTFVNGTALSPRVPHPVTSGASVRFGVLALLWCARHDALALVGRLKPRR